jgi:hypothetical protein
MPIDLLHMTLNLIVAVMVIRLAAIRKDNYAWST